MAVALSLDLLDLLEKKMVPYEFGDVPDVLVELYFALGHFLRESGEPLDPDTGDPLSELHKDW